MNALAKALGDRRWPVVKGGEYSPGIDTEEGTQHDSIMFHDGNRRLQEQFDSWRISDRLEEALTRQALTDNDRAFIE